MIVKFAETRVSFGITFIFVLFSENRNSVSFFNFKNIYIFDLINYFKNKHGDDGRRLW